MGHWKTPLLFLFIFGAGLLLSAARVDIAAASNDAMFTRYNIHVETQERVNGVPVYVTSYANYIYPPSGLLLLPPNSRVLLLNKSKPYMIEVLDKNIRVNFEFNANRMGMDFEHYMKKITSPTPVDLKGLTGLDRKGIEEGRALKGMSKRGVMMALGYPAVHRTPSLDSNSWTYWKDRYRTFRVQFDSSELVSGIID
ncbi:MAG: hypothetical protein A2X84_06475 [Desulfuromonadaceae bacterium GWC2_58_13]|nr:MAG: hypothetical protein A2X84_06475 [Desulfuromonadaceae bacterium GWC2_58_13]